MKKVAVFGKPGSGKSTFSSTLSTNRGLPYQPLDALLYDADGQALADDEYRRMHQQLLDQPEWIIDGFAPFTAIDSFYQRLAAADTLVYIDLPYATSYWLVGKRLIKGLLKTPEGWPKGSSILKGSWQSYQTLKRCPAFWNDDFLARLQQQSQGKTLYVIRSLAELNRLACSQS
jgi:adenylate kinase family enzyme